MLMEKTDDPNCTISEENGWVASKQTKMFNNCWLPKWSALSPEFQEKLHNFVCKREEKKCECPLKTETPQEETETETPQEETVPAPTYDLQEFNLLNVTDSCSGKFRLKIRIPIRNPLIIKIGADILMKMIEQYSPENLITNGLPCGPTKLFFSAVGDYVIDKFVEFAQETIDNGVNKTYWEAVSAAAGVIRDLEIYFSEEK